MKEQGEEVYSLLPERLAGVLRRLCPEWKKIQEIRIRQGKRMAVRYGGRLCFAPDPTMVISASECKEIVSQISRYSFYAFEEEIRRGYISIPGGHRIGVAGKVVLEHGEVKTLRHISCLNIRISHEIPGCSDWLMPYLIRGDKVYSTLLISPPGGGKTTLLRDIVRNVSRKKNVSVVDERSELAGCYLGIPQRELGPCCDVLDGCPKVKGIEMVLRSMGPEVIAVDEIGTKEDYDMMKRALVSGCTLLATMHGDTMRTVENKNLFQRYVVLDQGRQPGKVKAVYDERGQKIWS